MQPIQQAAFINGPLSSQGREGLSFPPGCSRKAGKECARGHVNGQQLRASQASAECGPEAGPADRGFLLPAPTHLPSPHLRARTSAPRGSAASKRKFLIGHYITGLWPLLLPACTGPPTGALSTVGLQSGDSAGLPIPRGLRGCSAGRSVMGAEKENPALRRRSRPRSIQSS